MDLEMIKELIKTFGEAGLTKFSYKCEDFELKLGKEQPSIITHAPAMMPTAGEMVQNTVVMPNSGVVTESIELAKVNAKTINSPMVGTFYAASNPKAAPFVTVGSKVKKGDVVCVIEAMKLMNEVEAEEDGEIVEILVNNEEMVEYGQPLFVLR